uniref:Protein arginine N-methyltransferase n=1 Tax=Oreochromis niloticus TaxID=8128 RepID=A0A669C4M9_ORENI
MKTFYGRANPTTGALDWVEESEEYDYHQEIARSCYADMLHDHDRNKKYYEGIRAAVTRVKARGEKVIVLDIGTGTGLLSMMAVTAGADFCYAVEVFKPMAEAAQCIVEKNGFSDKIKIINKHSTDVTVGPDGDMQVKANVLITELFDTELIGEGALPSYEHAHQNLMQDRCEAVPHRATVYAQLVESELLWSWAQLQPVEVEGARLVPPPAVGRCAGAHAVCDIQLSQVSPASFTPLGPVCTMFTVDFSKPVSSAFQAHSSQFVAQSSGRAQVVLSWWDLDMDPSGSIVCTMAPSWTYQEPKMAPWRDHWMQSVYFLPVESQVTEGEELSLMVCHDDYSLWYSLQPPHQEDICAFWRHRDCLCKFVYSRIRLRFNELCELQVLREDSVCLSVSDGSLLPVFAHMLGAKKVFGLENSQMSKQVIDEVSIQIILSGDALKCFSHCMIFILVLNTKPCSTCGEISLMWRGITDLWRIRAPCGTCEGFDVTPMDEMVQRSLDFHESREAEPHPLWEYPCRALTQSTAAMTFDFTQCLPQQPISTQGSLEGRCHGVALWMEYHLTDDITVSAGLTGPINEQGDCEWSRHRKQGVYFFGSPWEISGDGRAAVSYSFTFEPSLGDIRMDFTVTSQ